MQRNDWGMMGLGVLGVILLVLIVWGPAGGERTANGMGDAKISYGTCSLSTCHVNQGTDSLGIRVPAEAETGAEVAIIANFSAGNLTNARKVGVFLLRGTAGTDGDLPTADGWTVVSDPNGGTNNYVEVTAPGENTTMTVVWFLKAPAAPGTYPLTLRIQHGGGGNPQFRMLASPTGITVKAGGGTLTGGVYKAGTTQPLAGATVTAQPGVHSTVADVGGTYTLNLDPGNYTITVQATGYDQFTTNMTVKSGANLLNSFLAKSAPSTAGLSGYVYRGGDTTGLPAAAITVQPGNYTTVTNELGYFHFTLPTASYTVTAVLGGDGATANITLGTSGAVANLFLAPLTGDVSGFVYKKSTADPVANATVRDSAGGSTMTDARGHYTLTVPVGARTLWAESGSYTSGGVPVTVSTGEETFQNLFVALPRGSAVGYAYTSKDGTTTPLANATVSTRTGGYTTVSDATGRFSLSLETGAYTLVVTAKGFASQEAAVEVRPGETTVQNFLLPLPQGTYSGTVFRSGTNQPVAGATVLTSPRGLTAKSDPTGRFSVQGPTGNYTLSITASGYKTVTVTVAIKETPDQGQVFFLTADKKEEEKKSPGFGAELSGIALIGAAAILLLRKRFA